MFIVYSPEGRQRLPTQFERPTRLRKVSATDAVALNDIFLEHQHSDANTPKSLPLNPSINAYAQVQESSKSRKQIIVKASQVMSHPVITLEQDASMEQAWLLMQKKGVRHILLLNQDKLVGVVSDRDLWQHHNLGDAWSTEPGSVMWHAQSKVITTHADADIRHIAWVMSEYRVGALPVITEDERLLGMITRTDLIVRLANQPPLELFA
jgi:acetoin utilization protein AcuB